MKLRSVQPVSARINSAGRVRTTPGWRLSESWGMHFHDLDIWFVFDGTGWLKTQAQTYRVRPGFCLIARGQTVYEAWHDPGVDLGVNFIHFDLLGPGQKLIPAQTPGLPAPEPFYVQDAPAFDTLTRRVVQLYQSPQTQALSHVLLWPVYQDLVHQAQAWERAPHPGAPSALAQAIQHWACAIEEDPSRAPSVRAMARQAGCSSDHFSRAFKRALGQTPQQALVRARTRRALQLLQETDMKVRQIALSLGYCDEFFFSRQFKQQTGQTPRQARAGR